MFRIQFSVHGEVVVDRMLAGIDERARDLGPVWPVVLREFQRIEAKTFATEGASTGAPWPGLARATQADRARHGFPAAHPILERTGALKRALVEGEGAFNQMTPTSLRVILSEDVDYFKYHQSPRARRRLPRRAPVMLTADDRTALVHPVRLYITGRDVGAARRRPIE